MYDMVFWLLAVSMLGAQRSATRYDCSRLTPKNFNIVYRLAAIMITSARRSARKNLDTRGTIIRAL